GKVESISALNGIYLEHNGSFLNHYFASASFDSEMGLIEQPLFQVDAVSGGFACISHNEDGTTASGGVVRSVIVHDDDIFYNSGSEVLRARADRYTKVSMAVSPWNDYGLADEKILTSLVLSCEALPPDWTIYVDYATDNGTSWTNAITYGTDNGTGVREVVSTDSSAV